MGEEQKEETTEDIKDDQETEKKIEPSGEHDKEKEECNKTEVQEETKVEADVTNFDQETKAKVGENKDNFLDNIQNKIQLIKTAREKTVQELKEEIEVNN